MRAIRARDYTSAHHFVDEATAFDPLPAYSEFIVRTTPLSPGKSEFRGSDVLELYLSGSRVNQELAYETEVESPASHCLYVSRMEPPLRRLDY